MHSKALARVVLLTGLLVFVLSIIPYIYPIEQMELGVLNKYTISMIDDFDFNIINQLPGRMGWIVTQTLNSADSRSSGISTLWLPFFLYGKLISAISGTWHYGGYDPIDLAQGIASLFFMFLTMLLIQKLLAKFELPANKVWIWLLAFSTYFVFYSLAIPANTDVPTCFISALGIFLLSQDNKKIYHWMIIGCLSSIAISVKILGINLLFMAFWSLFEPSGDKIDKIKLLRKFLALLLGFLMVYVLELINTKIQYGSLMSVRSAFFVKLSLFYIVLENCLHYIFMRFTMAPVYLVSLVGGSLATFSIIRKKSFNDRSTYFALGASVFIFCKMVLLSMRFITNEMVGPRMFIADFVLITFLFFYALKKIKIHRSYIFVFLLICCLWTTIYSSTLSQGVGTISLQSYFIVRKILLAFFSTCSIAMLPKLIWFLPLALLVALIVSFHDRIVKKKVVNFIVIIFVMIRLVTTGLNSYFNKKNVMKMYSSGFYNSKVVAQGPLLFTYDDFFSEVSFEMTHSGPQKKKWVTDLVQRYLGAIKGEVIEDKSGLMVGKIANPQSYWDDEIFLHANEFIERRRNNCTQVGM